MAPEGWRLLPIADLADLQMGETLIAKDLTGDGIPVYSAGRSKEPWGFTSHARKRFQRGTIVVGARGSIGYPRLPTDDVFVCTQTTIAATPKAGTHPEFLAQALGAVDFSEVSAQQAVPMLTVAAFKEVEILTPPLAEQRKIAAILSSVDEAIEKTEAVIAQLDVVKKAMLEELLTRGIPGRHSRFKQTEIGDVPEEWRLVSLGDVGGQLGSLWSDGDWIESKDQDPSGGIRLLQVGNVRIGSVHLGGSARWINSETFQRLGCTEVRTGDILISRMADPIGRAGIVPAMPFQAVTAVDCAILRVDPSRVVSSYIVNYLNSPRTLARVASLATGTTRSRVSRTALGLLPVPLPLLDEQRALAQFFDVVDQRQQAEEAAGTDLREVKRALSSALLSGEVRVQSTGGAP